VHRFNTLTVAALLAALGCQADSGSTAAEPDAATADAGEMLADAANTPTDTEVTATADTATADTTTTDTAVTATADTAATDTSAMDPCAQTLKAVTFNIRYASLGDDNRSWLVRRDLVVDLITTMDPDVLGLQEVLSVQALDLRQTFDGYGFVGVGRNDGEFDGEFAAILYRLERFEAIDEGHFWMSATPEAPGTVFEGSAAIRMSSWVALRDRLTSRELLVLNTHWDHVSADSRERSATLTRDQLATLAEGRVVIMTGDLNTTPTSAPVQLLLADEPTGSPALVDGYRHIHPEAQDNERTFHNFNGRTSGQRIDYVLHDAQLRTLEAEIVRTEYDGVYPSDHFPVTGLVGYAFDGDGGPCPTQ